MRYARWLLILTIALNVGVGMASAAHRQTISPPFTLSGLHGPVIGDSLRGHVVLVDFWASWCEPCRRSFPWMTDLYRRRSADGLVIVAINLDKSRESANAFLEQHPAPFLVGFDPTGKTAEAFHVPGMPTSYLLGRDGAILESHVGFDPRKAAALEVKITQALKP